MKPVQIGKRRNLYLLLTLVLAGGFLAISLLSYFSSRKAIHDSIVSSQLPLTSDNIYSEIQKDLFRPILISSLMASDTFVRDWMLRGERDHSEMQRYLKEVMKRYGAFTAFFVSDATRNYYHADGTLRRVANDEPQDRWYVRVREMKEPYEINVDPDLANRNALTIFVNHRVLDYDGRFIGATGIGLTAEAVRKRVGEYESRYRRRILFVDTDGKIAVSGTPGEIDRQLDTLDGMAAVAPQIIAGGQAQLEYVRRGHVILLNTRFIPELKWHLLVEQDEDEALADVRHSLYLNILIVLLIAGVSIGLTALTVNRYQRGLEAMAITDKLTGLANRQAFAPLIEQLLAEIRRNPEPLSLLLIDVDHFKQVNDRHGHLAGDKLLQMLATCFTSAVRDADPVLRWGGEEFLVVLRDCDGESALHLADKLRQAAASTSLAVKGETLRPTVSIGVAERHADEDIEAQIGRADQALYAAKRDGRNCCRISA